MFWKNGVLAFVTGIVPCTINSKITVTMAIGRTFFCTACPGHKKKLSTGVLSSRYPVYQPQLLYGTMIRSRK